MRIIGGLQIGAPAPGDYSFMANLFGRLTKEVKNTGNLTRYVGYQSKEVGEDHLHFFGIEVDSIADIPVGMMALELNENTITLREPKESLDSANWRGELRWQWRGLPACAPETSSPPPASDRRFSVGEFSASLPPQWTAAKAAEERSFLLTANAYVAPGHVGSDDGVYLVDYDPSWPRQFEEMAQWIRRTFDSNIILRVEHYGAGNFPWSKVLDGRSRAAEEISQDSHFSQGVHVSRLTISFPL